MALSQQVLAPLASSLLAAAATSLCVFASARRRERELRKSQCNDENEEESSSRVSSIKSTVKEKKSNTQQPRKDKAAERLEWWQRLNQVKPDLVIPDVSQSDAASRALEEVKRRLPEAAAVHDAVAKVAYERLNKGKDWLVRDSDYGIHSNGTAPAHAGVKVQVNAAIVKATVDTFGTSLQELLSADPRRILLLLDTPTYGTFSSLVEAYPALRCCQQVVIPQADLGHYFEMTRSGGFYPGIRAQRLDHWLCANHELELKSLVAFLDYECRLVGAMSARLCPAADIMRFFRFRYPAAPTSILAITVGLEEPAATPEKVDAFVQYEAALNGYTVELVNSFKYRMVMLLYIVRCADAPSVA